MIKKFFDKERKKKHSGDVLDSKSGFSVIECKECKFKHIAPMPSDKKLDNIYREEYYSEEKPQYFRRIKRDLEWWNLVYGDKYGTFESNLSKKGRRILDVGSGPGYFLLHGKKRGWETLGIEPSRQAASHARKLGILVSENFLDGALAKTLGKFDVVHMSEVIEHLPDPAGMIKIIHSLLKTGGIICIDAPNDYNPIQHTLRTVDEYKPWWVAPPHHINYFDFSSIRKLLEKNKFKVFLEEGTFPIDMFLLMGDNYIGNDKLGRKCHGKRKRLELSLAKAGHNDMKRKLYQACADIGIGRNLVMYGRKI
jgi:2-polyprenyl-3-methyl-5-hydroxy-6-metoxy-1,4-benzoquinol methylase